MSKLNSVSVVVNAFLSSRSVSFAFETQQVYGPLTALEWAVTRMKSAFGGAAEIFAMVNSSCPLKPLVDAAGRAGIAVLELPPSAAVRLYASVAAHLRSDHILFVNVSAGLLPDAVFRNILAVHEREGTACTTVRHLPRGCLCELYRRDVLQALPSVWLPAINASYPLQLLEALRSAESATNSPSPVNTKTGCVDLFQLLDPTDTPESTWLEDRRSVESLASLLASVPAEQEGSVEYLRRWKALRIERRETLRRPSSAPARPCASLGPLPVLYVSFQSAYSGGEASLCQLIRNLDHAAVAPFALVSYEGTLTKHLREAGAHVICPDMDLGKQNGEVLQCIRDTITAVHPAIVHFNAIQPPHLSDLPWQMGIPSVQHVRIADLGNCGTLLASADVIVAISEFVRREILLLDIPRRRVEVVLNGIDVTQFDPKRLHQARARRTLGLREDAMFILMIARFARNKRHDVILRAMRTVSDRLPQARLLLVGEVYDEVQYYEQIKDLIEELGVRPIVDILPFQEDIQTVHAAADIVAQTSEREPLGRAIMEAMALERPVIVADSGGLPELVEAGKSGIVVPVGDDEALAEAIVKVAETEDLRRRLIHEGRQRVCACLSIAQHARRMERIYRHITQPERAANNEEVFRCAVSEF